MSIGLMSLVSTQHARTDARGMQALYRYAGQPAAFRELGCSAGLSIYIKSSSLAIFLMTDF